MRVSKILFGLSVIAAPTLAFGQQQVAPQGSARGNPQVNQAVGGGQPVDTRVGGELYGNNAATSGSTRYQPQILYLPSEERFAIERSGALPSEIRMQAEAVGPLAPYGRASYVPDQSEFQRAVKARPPVLFGPQWSTKAEAAAGSLGPAPIQEPALPPRPETPPPPQYLQPQQIHAGQMIDRRVGSTFAGTEPAETIHYYRLPTKATTQPATQPSLGDEVKEQ